MSRRLLFAGALVVCVAGSAMLAAERATFILTTGERVSGQINFHTDARNNIYNGQFAIGTMDGKEVYARVDQVAVIDFIGGKPKTSELEALPAGSGQLLALRDGTTRRGSLLDLIGGDTVKWRAAQVGPQDIPIRDVARIYLNADSARNLFDYTPPAPTPATPVVTPPTTTTGRQQTDRFGRPIPGTNAAGDGLQVRGTADWVNTGITVRANQRVTFGVTGTINFGKGPGDTANADGNDALRRNSYPVPTMGAGGLIGKIGNGEPFPIGASGRAIVMPESGRLMLAVNDDNRRDNTGSFFVVITVR